MKKVLLFTSSLLAVTFCNAQNCPPNWDFEMGNFTNWSAATASPHANNWTYGIDTMQHSIQQGNGLDPCGNFPVVCPNGSSYSVRIGSLINLPPIGQSSMISYALTVDSSNVNLTFYYALVMQSYFSYFPSDVTRWEFLITDSSGNTTIVYQITYNTVQGMGQVSLSCSNTDYLPWAALNVDLSNYWGQQITVAFTVSDDVTGGDDGYAYIDACGLPLATNEFANQSEILLYPNPTSGVFTITTEQSAIKNIEVYNMLGEKVSELMSERVNKLNPATQQLNNSITQ